MEVDNPKGETTSERAEEAPASPTTSGMATQESEGTHRGEKRKADQEYVDSGEEESEDEEDELEMEVESEMKPKKKRRIVSSKTVDSDEEPMDVSYDEVGWPTFPAPSPCNACFDLGIICRSYERRHRGRQRYACQNCHFIKKGCSSLPSRKLTVMRLTRKARETNLQKEEMAVDEEVSTSQHSQARKRKASRSAIREGSKGQRKKGKKVRIEDDEEAEDGEVKGQKKKSGGNEQEERMKTRSKAKGKGKQKQLAEDPEEEEEQDWRPKPEADDTVEWDTSK